MVVWLYLSVSSIAPRSQCGQIFDIRVNEANASATVCVCACVTMCALVNVCAREHIDA